MSSEGALTLVVGLLSSGVLTVLVTGLLSRRKTSADTTLVLTEAAGKIIEQLQNRVKQVEDDLAEERVARREAEQGRREAEARAEQLARDLAYIATLLVEEANRADAAARLREFHDRNAPTPLPPAPLPPAPTPDPGGTP